MSPQSYVVVQDANDNRLFEHHKNYPEPTSKRFQKEKNLKITRETDGKMSSCYGKAAAGRRSEHRLSRFYSTKFCNIQGGCIKISENIQKKSRTVARAAVKKVTFRNVWSSRLVIFIFTPDVNKLSS